MWFIQLLYLNSIPHTWFVSKHIMQHFTKGVIITAFTYILWLISVKLECLDTISVIHRICCMEITDCSMDPQSHSVSPFVIPAITSVQNNILESLLCWSTICSTAITYWAPSIWMSWIYLFTYFTTQKAMFFKNERFLFRSPNPSCWWCRPICAILLWHRWLNMWFLRVGWHTILVTPIFCILFIK